VKNIGGASKVWKMVVKIAAFDARLCGRTVLLVDG